MNILYLLIPLGLVLLGIAVWAFMWAVRSGQFDDLEGPAHRILMDDDEKRHFQDSKREQTEQQHGDKDHLQDKDK
ncbi:MAG: cbb3-type cytochrome oxidase assembly protein CcoS [Thioalkalispiraceae bacterium]|jgi:cbb3-type cytochrome oxidase maturation protein